MAARVSSPRRDAAGGREISVRDADAAVKRLAVITGASSGVGEAAAREFVARGYRVVLIARSADRLERLAGDLGAAAMAAPADAAESDQIGALAGRVLDRLGAPDVIVHAAGAGGWKTVPETTPDEAATMMAAPYFADFLTTRAFLPAMLARGSGVILHINSPAAILPWPSSAGYAAARAAVRGFHEALAQDLAGTGVRSCHVIFGRIASQYFDNNPGVIEKMPKLAAAVPVLSPDYCARKLANLAGRPRHNAVFPLILSVSLRAAVIFPSLVRWLLRL